MNRERLRKSPNIAIVGSTSLLGKELREMLEEHHLPKLKVRSIMQSQIGRTIDEIVMHVPSEGSTELIALGGDVRFAAWRSGLSRTA